MIYKDLKIFMEGVYNFMGLSFWNDLRKSYAMLGVAFYFAWSDTKARYKRSFLGPFWIVIATAVGVVGLGALWSIIFRQPLSSIMPSITLGLVFWYFISGCIIEAPSIFISNASSIKGYPNPYLLFVFKHVIKHLIILAHNFLIIVLVCIFFGILRSVYDYLMFFIGMLVVTMNLIWMSAFLAIVSVRFRDIELIIPSVMPIIFFLTPVIFKPQQVESIKYIMYLNPFSSLIRVIRDPLYSDILSYGPLFVCSLMLIVGLIITPIIYKRMIREVPYLL